MNPISKEESQYLYMLKFFALISIVGSHTVGVREESGFIIKSMSEVMNIFGALGVGVFLLISGYLFASNKKSMKEFIFAKINSILIPWGGAGLLVYITTIITNPTIFQAGLGSYLIGGVTQNVVTPLYFLVILFAFYFIYFKFKSNNNFLYLTIILSGISIILTAAELIILPNKYLNPFIFMIYFAFGILLRNKKLTLLEIGLKLRSKNIVLIGMYFVFIISCRFTGISLGYFGYGTLIAQTIGISMILGLATLPIFGNQVVVNIGKWSFFIYLFHMPVAWFIKQMTNYLHLDFLVVLRPFLVIAFFYLVIKIAPKYTMTNRILQYLGIRG